MDDVAFFFFLFCSLLPKKEGTKNKTSSKGANSHVQSTKMDEEILGPAPFNASTAVKAMKIKPTPAHRTEATLMFMVALPEMKG